MVPSCVITQPLDSRKLSDYPESSQSLSRSQVHTLAPTLEITGGCGGHMFGGPILCLHVMHKQKKATVFF